MKKMLKNKKALITGGCILIVIIGILVLTGTARGKAGNMTIAEADTTVLSYGDIQSSLSGSGRVESAQSVLVYSTLSYPVKSVKAQVGDEVKKGQLLATLDAQSVEKQIRSQEISLKQSKKSGALSVESAQNNYDNFLSGMEKGLNSTLLSAKSQVDSAMDSYKKAKQTYDRYKTSLDAGENTTLNSALTSMNNAADSLNSAWDSYYDVYDTYKTAKSKYDTANAELSSLQTELEALKKQLETLQNQSDGQQDQAEEIKAVQEKISAKNEEISQKTAEVASSKTALEAERTKLNTADQSISKARDTYDSAKTSYNAAKRTVDNTLEDYLDSIDSAWESYEKSLTSLSATEKSLNEQLASYELALRQAKNNANTESAEESLRQLRVELNSTNIKAPTSGTITAVYATEGSSGAGLLFVIEDLTDLVIETSVKDYDLNNVRVGTKVEITSDVTGAKTIEGKVKSIAPTVTKNAQGETDTTVEAAFQAVVEIVTKDTGLPVGVEAQLSYRLAEEKSVLAVPYDAVYTNDAGTDCVLVMREQNDGSFLIEELPVNTGIDNDLDIAISGEGVSEGLRIINEPENYRSMMGKKLTLGESSTNKESGGMTFPQPGGGF